MASTVHPHEAHALLQTLKRDGFDVDASLDRCLHAVGMKRETFAHLLGVSGTRLAQMTHHDGRLSLQALGAATLDADGKQVVAALVREWADSMGLEDLDAVARRFAEATELMKKRMARATLRQPQTSRRTA